MVVVAQLVRASDCDSEGRGFETHLPPKNKSVVRQIFFCLILFDTINDLSINICDAFF